MNFDVAELLVALGIGGALTAAIGGLFQKGKVRAERTTLEAQADEILSKATKTIVESWETTNTALRDDLKRTKDELEATRSDLNAARNEISAAGRALRVASDEVANSNRRFDKMLEQLRLMNIDVVQILENTTGHSSDSGTDTDYPYGS